MTNEMELVVGCDGVARRIYDEALDLREIGKLQITRASHVEPDGDGFWWADMGPVGGPVLGPYGWQSVGGIGGGEGMAGFTRYPTVHLTCLRNFAGVQPVRRLKTCVKWLWEEKPRSRAMLARGKSILSASSDRQIRLRFTKRPMLNPVECRNFFGVMTW